MASMSVLGYGYRLWWDDGLSQYQIQTWLCAYPVVLLMAPLGAFVLSKINKEWMLRGVAVLNLAQVGYFLINKPSLEKGLCIVLFGALLSGLFWYAIRSLEKSAAAGRL